MAAKFFKIFSFAGQGALGAAGLVLPPDDELLSTAWKVWNAFDEIDAQSLVKRRREWVTDAFLTRAPSDHSSAAARALLQEHSERAPAVPFQAQGLPDVELARGVGFAAPRERASSGGSGADAAVPLVLAAHRGSSLDQ